MTSIYNFIVKPFSSRYDNEKKIGDNSLLLNTSIESFRHVSKKAIVIAVPSAIHTDIQPGDEVMIHHNIFRRYYDVRGKEKNSGTYFKENMYFAFPDQIYAYKKDGKWNSHLDYCFVKPILNTDSHSLEKEQKHIGILKYGNSSLNELEITSGDLVGYTPNSEFEFLFEEERLYCMKSNDISIKYERKGNETEYNSCWTSSN